jgi:hypothetical protein
MDTVYAPDAAPDLEPEVVHWQPRYKTHEQREAELRIAVGFAIAALGALAIGALAIGALAVGRMSVGDARFRRLEIGDLGVGRIRRLRRAF